MSATIFSPAVGLRQLSDHWCLSQDGDPHCLEMYRRHYSRRRYREDRQPLFIGPGFKLVLLSTTGDALFVWPIFRDDCRPPQTGINCAVFRNESSVLSSDLIREAVRIAWDRWCEQRCYTLVNPSKIRSVNPGYCFKCAGWRRCGTSATGKTILELLP